MRLPGRTRSSVFDLQMTAMIDVVFLLLVFFLWTSSFDEPEFDLVSNIALPPVGNANAANENPPVMFDEIVVRIVSSEAGNEEIRFNGSVLDSVQALGARLRSIATVGAQPSVIIDPDATVAMATAISVYDIARDAGFDRVLFTVSQ